MFITIEDYKVVLNEASLGVVAQEDNANRRRAEAEAIEEISGYLRPKYDVKKIFEKEGGDRNSYLVMITVDVALFHLSSSLPGKMGYDARKERYDNAIKWLEGVQKGNIVPDLPLAVDEHGQSATPIRFGSETRHDNTW